MPLEPANADELLEKAIAVLALAGPHRVPHQPHSARAEWERNEARNLNILWATSIATGIADSVAMRFKQKHELAILEIETEFKDIREKLGLD
jgi:hypothetical protein